MAGLRTRYCTASRTRGGEMRRGGKTLVRVAGMSTSSQVPGRWVVGIAKESRNFSSPKLLGKMFGATASPRCAFWWRSGALMTYLVGCAAGAAGANWRWMEVGWAVASGHKVGRSQEWLAAQAVRSFVVSWFRGFVASPSSFWSFIRRWQRSYGRGSITRCNLDLIYSVSSLASLASLDNHSRVPSPPPTYFCRLKPCST